ncbi:MAG: hypothetical protein HYX77_00120 [Acidobacteria bacterium]|nr:hypothetical protein [Acidobacteriota bacterium]
MEHHDVVASADQEYLETPSGSTYEHTDADVWIIVKFLFWLAVSAVIIHVGLGLVYGLLIERAMETGEQRYPLAVAQGERLPPAPRLQQFPRKELDEFRQGEESLLQRYGWMNRNAGIVHIPIEDAMRLTVERGLPSRTPEGGRSLQTPGLMPSDASSGRMMERSRQ